MSPYSLRFCNWMNESACSFSSMYLSPLSKNGHFRKNPSVNNEHLCTAVTAMKTKIENIPTNNIHQCTGDTTVSKRIQTLYGNLCQPSIHIAEQVHVWKTLQTKNKTFPFPLNINQPMPDDQFIFSSFWLPCPRFELGPWPVTVPNVKSLVKINSTCCWDFQMRYDGYQRTNKTCLNWG